MNILSGDIGGTHSRLQLYRSHQGQLQSLAEARFVNNAYSDFEQVVYEFLQQQQDRVDAATFAIAGPILDAECVELTNIDWYLDSKALQSRFGFQQVALLNDFAAIAYGAPLLSDSGVHHVQTPAMKIEGQQNIRAFVGAGTGLGQAISLSVAGQTNVLASEAGHSSFAPVTGLQRQLLDYYSQEDAVVDNEFFLSGRGLVHIYNALNQFNGGDEDSILSVLADDSPARVTQGAAEGVPLALQTVQVFWQVYAAYAGDVALQCLPYAGLYLAGGIAPRLLPFLDVDDFVFHFQNKNAMHDVLTQIPVMVITDDCVARLGAAEYLLQQR